MEFFSSWSVVAHYALLHVAVLETSISSLSPPKSLGACCRSGRRRMEILESRSVTLP